MSDFQNATLYVSSFDATGNPGEYTVTDAQYATQYDTQGNAALAVTPGFILFVPASNPNDFSIIPGVVHRYVFTECSASPDGATLSGTLIWNELGSEVDSPTSGAYCLLSEPTPNLQLGLYPSDLVYPNLSPGTSWGALLTDLKNIVDLVDYLKSKTFAGAFTLENWTSNGDSTSTVTITHGLNSTFLLVSCWQQIDTILQMTPLNPIVVDNNTFKFTVMSESIFPGQVTVALAKTP